jgi:hypothetical protein
VKQSQARDIRKTIILQHPQIEPYIDLLFPKKFPMVIAKRCVVSTPISSVEVFTDMIAMPSAVH